MAEKVKIKLDGQKIVVDGPKGSLSRILPSLVCCTMDEGGQNLFVEKTNQLIEELSVKIKG